MSTLVHTVVDTPVIGPLTLVASEGHLAGVYFAEHAHAPQDVGPRKELAASPAVLRAAAVQLEEYFLGLRTEFELPVAVAGTAFQHKVWGRLRQIPYGQTLSYGRLAADVGQPGASRAVGVANGKNPVSIIVPCHRVVGSDGSITGYAGGPERKRALLDLEERVAGASLF